MSIHQSKALDAAQAEIAAETPWFSWLSKTLSAGTGRAAQGAAALALLASVATTEPVFAQGAPPPPPVTVATPRSRAPSSNGTSTRPASSPWPASRSARACRAR